MIPIEPPPGLIDSMCMRFRHDFGLTKQPGELSSGLTDSERDALRRQMRQLYDEVAGTGFFRWPQV